MKIIEHVTGIPITICSIFVCGVCKHNKQIHAFRRQYKDALLPVYNSGVEILKFSLRVTFAAINES